MFVKRTGELHRPTLARLAWRAGLLERGVAVEDDTTHNGMDRKCCGKLVNESVVACNFTKNEIRTK